MVKENQNASNLFEQNMQNSGSGVEIKQGNCFGIIQEADNESEDESEHLRSLTKNKNSLYNSTQKENKRQRYDNSGFIKRKWKIKIKNK